MVVTVAVLYDGITCVVDYSVAACAAGDEGGHSTRSGTAFASTGRRLGAASCEHICQKGPNTERAAGKTSRHGACQLCITMYGVITGGVT